jgi:hypothetical protein
VIAGEPFDHLACFSHGDEDLPRDADRVTIDMPAVFSFVREPQLATRSIRRIAAAALAGAAEIEIELGGLEHVDTCAASTMLAVLEEAGNRGSKITLRLPHTERLLPSLAAAGASRMVAAEDRTKLPKPSLFPLHRGRRAPEWDKKKAQKAAGIDGERIYDRLAAWLEEHGRGTPSAEFSKSFGHGFGEAMTNAATHSDSDWWISEHVENGTGGAPILHVTVFNFGQSIASTIQAAPRGFPTLEDYELLIAEHERRDGFDTSWTKADLLTLLAIQDGSTAFEDERGVGTLRGLELFEYILAQAPEGNPRMCWISGTTRVLLDGRYTLQESRLERRRTAKRRDIAFNAAKDLRDRPDPSAVTNLGCEFPGTLLTLQFAVCDCFLQ